MEILKLALAKYSKLLVDHRLLEALAVVFFVVLGAPELANVYATNLDPQVTDAIVLVAQLLVPVIMGHKIITSHTDRKPSGLDVSEQITDVEIDLSDPNLADTLKTLREIGFIK